MQTVRCKPPSSLSYNHSSYLFDDTFERNPLLISLTINSKCCCCCCCCYYDANISMCNRLGEVNPRFLSKRFSQSTLIKWSINKKLIFYGGIGHCYGSNIYGFSSFTNLDRSSYYEKLCAFKERKKQKQRGFWYDREKQFLSPASDDYVNDVEVMLSLLTNEMDLEYVDVRDRKKINRERKNVGSGGLKSDFKWDKVGKIRSLTKSGNLDLRKEGSPSELKGDEDFEVKCDGYVGQTSSSEYKIDLEKDCNTCIDEVMGNVGRLQESVQEKDGLLEKKDVVKGIYGESVGISQDWIKKSEKKLNEEFSQHEPNISVNTEPCRQHSYEVEKVTDESGSRMKYKRSEEMSNKDKSVIESTSTTEKKLKMVLETSKTQEIDRRGTSSLSESRIKSLEEKSTEVNDQINDNIEEKHQKVDEKSQQMLRISGTHFSNRENTSVSHRKDDIREEKQQQYPETSSSSEAIVTNSEGVGKATTASVENIYTSSDMKVAEEVGGSRNLSQGSGPKGPSDEMWHVTDASTQDPSETDAPDNVSDLSENGEPVKTSGRSLWTVIGDVVRLHWKSPLSGSHTPNSGDAKGSSYMSASSKTWFTSHDSNYENEKKKSTKGVDSPYNNVGPSRSISLPIIRESSFPLPAIQMIRSPEIKKTSEAIENRKSGNDSKNGELKRRKLVHKDDQVSEDTFDEWEEVYTFEAKQRKIDEMFMKEALLEAKKAADVWEVPVGAVLVKGGKIIARGHNLVEELRDSTAHAEMICIRKASTNLQSWRLLDTTLYVTLEPCPMCAGAILQARIDRVVWGAPNKLLGTYGSWIRLFSDENGGSGSMVIDMPPAPAHPFHPHMSVRRGVLAAECAEVMQNFFRLKRNKTTGPGATRDPPTPSSINVSHHNHSHHSNFFSKIHDAFKIIFCL